jgi:hypothetical protein
MARRRSVDWTMVVRIGDVLVAARIRAASSNTDSASKSLCTLRRQARSPRPPGLGQRNGVVGMAVGAASRCSAAGCLRLGARWARDEAARRLRHSHRRSNQDRPPRRAAARGAASCRRADADSRTDGSAGSAVRSRDGTSRSASSSTRRARSWRSRRSTTCGSSQTSRKTRSRRSRTASRHGHRSEERHEVPTGPRRAHRSPRTHSRSRAALLEEHRPPTDVPRRRRVERDA